MSFRYGAVPSSNPGDGKKEESKIQSGTDRGSVTETTKAQQAEEGYGLKQGPTSSRWGGTLHHTTPTTRWGASISDNSNKSSWINNENAARDGRSTENIKRPHVWGYTTTSGAAISSATTAACSLPSTVNALNSITSSRNHSLPPEDNTPPLPQPCSQPSDNALQNVVASTDSSGCISGSSTLPIFFRSAQCPSTSEVACGGKLPEKNIDEQHIYTSNSSSAMTTNKDTVGSLLSATADPLLETKTSKIDRTNAANNIMASSVTHELSSSNAEQGDSRAEDNTSFNDNSSARTVPLVMTCTSLGTGDLKVAKRAENAVLKLYKLLSLPNHNTYNGALVLPTKDQIVKGLADTELQIKILNQQKHQVVIKMEQQQQQKKKQQEEEEERKKNEDIKRREEEEKSKKELEQQLLQQQEERQRKKDENLKILKQQLEELLMKKHQQFEQQQQQRQLQEAELENEWKPKVENKLKVLRKAKHSVQKAKMHLTTVQHDLSLLQDDSPKEGAAAEEEDEGEEENFVNMPVVLSSVMEENRKRAQQAHWNSISACLPLPNETVNGSIDVTPIVLLKGSSNAEGIINTPCENTSKQVAIIDDDYEEQETLKPVTNEQWTALTRRIMSPVDALYTDPTESLYWDYHEQRHNVLKDLIFDQIRKKKMTLHQYWETLATDYIALQTLWKKRKVNLDSTNSAASSDQIMTNNGTNEDNFLNGESNSLELQQDETTNKRNIVSAIHMSTLQASFRRNRRPLRGANSSTNAFIRGLGDVVRSEYEQELIIKELTEKEAMEKRIKHGGCSLPRQVSSLERELLVSYRVDFTPRRVMDPKREERDMKHINPWTDMEKCIFFDRFLLFPKDFKKIASFLRNKTTMDCVAFYYDAKKSLPFKAALREHLLRKRRGRTAENCNISWMATVQAAVSAGASVSEGDGSDERPFTFSIPGGDNTYSTSKFHPMQRDVVDLSRVDSSECSVTTSSRSGSVSLNQKRFSLMSNDPKLASCHSSSAVAAYGSNDDDDDDASKPGSTSGSKRRQCSHVASVGDTDSKLIRTSLTGSVHDGKAFAEPEDNIEITKKAEEEVPKSCSTVGSSSRKVPQKWAPKEKKIFFETIEQHGKDWPALVAAVGNKTLQQVKNFYYDSNKKQASKYQQQQLPRSYSRESSDERGSVKDSSINPPEVEESSSKISLGKIGDESFVQKSPSVDPVSENPLNGNNAQHNSGLHAQMLRDNQIGPAGIGPISGLPGQYTVVDRVGQNTHHDFLPNLNMNPWAAAAQQFMHQSRDPGLRMREAWALEASIRQQQQQFQQMAYSLGGQATGAHFPHDILGHIRASAGYSSPVPFVNTPPSDAQQAALVALSQMSVARNLAAVAQRMASRSGESSAVSRPPDLRSNPAGFSGPFKRDTEYGNDSSSK